MDIKRFTIRISEATLDDLHERLARTRWPDEIAGANWEYGANLQYMQQLLEYWQDEFDWREQESRLNSFAHYTSKIDGQEIHYVHKRGNGPKPVPLIITHGWPGSFVEMLKIIPLLTDPAAHGDDAFDSFDVVVPSLPGYGFSARPIQKGMNVFRIADLWRQLMEGLGYSSFGAQGGDWGASVSTCLGLKYPQQIIGLHLNYIPGSFKPYFDASSPELSSEERSFLEEQSRWVEAEGGYGQVQRTKPQTLAYGLNDSPLGLAAWIVEKFRDWSDCDGEVERRFTKDELLTNVMIYWLSESIGSSMRLYYEGRLRPLNFKQGERVDPPCGIVKFIKEAPFPPREWVERGYNVQRWTEIPTGGHFAALEEPELLVKDIRAFFGPLRCG